MKTTTCCARPTMCDHIWCDIGCETWHVDNGGRFVGCPHVCDTRSDQDWDDLCGAPGHHRVYWDGM